MPRNSQQALAHISSGGSGDKRVLLEAPYEAFHSAVTRALVPDVDEADLKVRTCVCARVLLLFFSRKK